MRVKFFYETTDTVVNRHIGSVEVPDDEDDIYSFIQENMDSWEYEDFDSEQFAECIDGPRDIEVIHAG
jgi:hypothetical protein